MASWPDGERNGFSDVDDSERNRNPQSVSERLTGLGPFFAADGHDPHSTPVAPWRSMVDLLDDPAVLAARVDTSRAYLAAASGQQPDDVELRVAASITHLGLAARALSPLYAAAVLFGPIRPISLRDLRWQPTVPSTFPLSIAGLDQLTDGRAASAGTRASASADTVARSLAAGALETVAAELCAVTEPFGLSERVLWGNIASAVNGARTALSSASPHHAPRARAVVDALLRQPVLAATWQTSLDDRFQRRSCCLIYRAAPDRDGQLCGDCILLGRHSRSRTGLSVHGGTMKRSSTSQTR